MRNFLRRLGFLPKASPLQLREETEQRFIRDVQCLVSSQYCELCPPSYYSLKEYTAALDALCRDCEDRLEGLGVQRSYVDDLVGRERREALSDYRPPLPESHFFSQPPYSTFGFP